MTPLFGLTQYRFGAVVFTLKHTRLSEGLVNFKSAVTTSLNGPKKKIKQYVFFVKHNGNQRNIKNKIFNCC
jgi:hypothetical protein